MKNYVVNNEELNIKSIEEIREETYFRKVEREFFTHDEDIHHINSLVALNIGYTDFEDQKHNKEIIFYKEYIKESFGWELDFDIYDFIECVNETDEFKEAKKKADDFLNRLKEDFKIN